MRRIGTNLHSSLGEEEEQKEETAAGTVKERQAGPPDHWLLFSVSGEDTKRQISTRIRDAQQTGHNSNSFWCFLLPGLSVTEIWASN